MYIVGFTFMVSYWTSLISAKCHHDAVIYFFQCRDGEISCVANSFLNKRYTGSNSLRSWGYLPFIIRIQHYLEESYIGTENQNALSKYTIGLLYKPDEVSSVSIFWFWLHPCLSVRFNQQFKTFIYMFVGTEHAQNPWQSRKSVGTKENLECHKTERKD